MCLLTFFPENVMPDVDALLNGATFNNDGHGWAIADGDELLVGHGLKDEEVIEEFLIARYAKPDGPALFHSRFTTHGESTVENCHPFYVGRDQRTVLAHNGVLPENVQPRKGDKRSDTRIAAEGFIPSIGSLRHRRTRLQVEKWMGDYNKIVVLTVNPRYRERSYLLNEEAGTWDGGIWYSNNGYLPYVPSCASKNKWADMYEGECVACKAIIDLVEDEHCPYCWTCQECEMDKQECQCYRPMALAKRSDGTGWPEWSEHDEWSVQR